jgi:hypothetical protein
VTPSSTTLTAIDDSVGFAAQPQDRNGHAVSGVALVWSSANPAIVSATAAGYARAVSSGSADLVVSSGTITGRANVVVSQTVHSLTVARDTFRLAGVGDTARIIPVPRDRNGHAAAGASYLYASSNTAVATVGPTGLVTLTGSGAASITVTSGAMTTPVTVIGGITVDASVSWIRVTPATTTLALGDTVVFVADLMGPGSTATRITPAWSSDVPARLTLLSDGRAVGGQVGSAVVSATYSGLVGRATATITAAPVVTGFQFAPRVLNGVTGNAVTFSVSVTAADAGAGITSVQTTFTGPSGATQSCTATAPVWGSRNNGGWDCAITIPAGSATGTWRASAVRMVGTITRIYGESVLSGFGGTTLEVRP